MRARQEQGAVEGQLVQNLSWRLAGHPLVGASAGLGPVTSPACIPPPEAASLRTPSTFVWSIMPTRLPLGLPSELLKISSCLRDASEARVMGAEEQ